MCISIYTCIYIYTQDVYIYTYITLHYITLHYITLHYITLHYITLHYITLHYITLHYIHTYIYIYINHSNKGTSLLYQLQVTLPTLAP